MRTPKATRPLAVIWFALVGRSVAEIDDERRMGFPQAKPHSGSNHRVLTSSSGADSIVGVGFLSSSSSVVSTGDELPTASPPEEELVDDLEEDDRVTVQSIQLGGLLCESLVNAEDAPVLAFSVGPNETFSAIQSSFTVLNGSIFEDGISRKVWTGVEVVNDQTAAVPSRTVSMTYGEVCDAETFLLEISRQFLNGTLIVSKTIPCEAGGPFDICFVELDLRLPDEDDSDEVEVEVPPSGDVRRLGDSHLNYVAGKGQTYETETAASTGRQLQESTTQIDIMFMYTPGGRDVLGVSDSQMQSVLADSLITVNEAMANSDIDLHLSLVRVEPLPYEEESIASRDVLTNLRNNEAVDELRDLYGADLIQLVADLGAGSGTGSCGRAILPFFPFEEFAFGVVDPYCFFQFSHTHEIAHNMGTVRVDGVRSTANFRSYFNQTLHTKLSLAERCFHNREDSGTQHPYAHGYRYCEGDLPYRTILSYACRDVLGDVIPVPRVNYFSNPNVTFDEKPTGTITDNCARRILETKDAIASYRDPSLVPTTPPTVVPTTPPPVTTPTPPPVPTPTPPPVPTPTPPPVPTPTPPPVTTPTPVPTMAADTCSNGIVGVERGTICCALGCGSCGGTGCGRRGRDEGLTAEDCCTSRISRSGVFCDNSGNAPCIIGEAPTPAPVTVPVVFPTPEPTSPTEIEVGEVTTVSVIANGFDERTSGSGCPPNGCLPANTRDGSLSSRWSCRERLLDDDVQCEIIYIFDDAQAISVMRIAFYQGSQRTRRLEVKINGSTNSEIESSGLTDQFEDFDLNVDKVGEISLTTVGLGVNQWISLLEVEFILA